jgi:hypothetical protein
MTRKIADAAGDDYPGVAPEGRERDQDGGAGCKGRDADV